MGSAKGLPPESLYRRCSSDQWDFETTDEVTPLTGAVGQQRAEEALDFGIGVIAHGYNLFAVGPPRLGKHRVVEERLKRAAQEQEGGSDWCYVHNFEEPRAPKALQLPSGRGRELQKAMQKLVEELLEALPTALRGEEFHTAQQAIEEAFRRQQDEALEVVREQAKEHNIAVIRTPSGVVMAPMENGEVVGPGDFQDRPLEERNQFEQRLQELHRELEQTMGGMPKWERERRQKLDRLERSTAAAVVEEHLGGVREKFAGVEVVERFLDAVEEDMIEHRAEFMRVAEESGQMAQAFGMPFGGDGPPAWVPDVQVRYGVNVLVDRAKESAAPVVREHHPTLENMMGRIDHQARFGALSTDYSMIRPGALHKANGGYLIVDARDVLRQPLGWEQFKRALRSERVRIETPGQILGMVSTVSLEPEEVPLEVKVVLVGDRMIYELLLALDPDFEDLFKVVVDFNEACERRDQEGGESRFVQLLAGLIEEQGHLPFDRGAVARVIEEASRMAGDASKVTLEIESLRDLLSEAVHFARGQSRKRVQAEDVQQALEARRYRGSRLKERQLEAIGRRHLTVETDGEVVAQVNGLSVLTHAGYRFGMPSRITATVRLGRGEVVDIAREVEMAGPIHSRGVLILNGYLGMTFGTRRPLTLSASLVFEQTYGRVDGDSASLAETVALLSALSDVPIRQSLAVTGAIDQQGNVQAVGGINEKIEGFFDACQRLGATAHQGVIIPQSNVEHLMLRQDVVQAVEDGEFAVYAVERVEEAVKLLTGVDAGEVDESGVFDSATVFGRVEARLEEFARAARNWSGGGGARP